MARKRINIALLLTLDSDNELLSDAENIATYTSRYEYNTTIRVRL